MHVVRQWLATLSNFEIKHGISQLKWTTMALMAKLQSATQFYRFNASLFMLTISVVHAALFFTDSEAGLLS